MHYRNWAHVVHVRCAPSKINFEVDCLFENAYALQSMSAIFFTLSKMNVLYPIGKIADMKVNLLS